MAQLKTLLALIATLLLAQGCAAPGIPLDGTVSVSPEFTPEQAEAVIGACEAWATATKGKVNLRVSVSADNADLMVSPAHLDVLMGFTEIEGSKGTMRLDGAWIMADSSAPAVGSRAMWTYTAMHELGHALGLDHKDHTLMREVGYGGLEVDQETLEQFESVR